MMIGYYNSMAGLNAGFFSEGGGGGEYYFDMEHFHAKHDLLGGLGGMLPQEN